MKKVLSGLALMAAITACQAPQAGQFVNPAVNSQIRAAAAAQQAAQHNPDFARKLREGANYRFTADVNVSSICGPNDLQHVNSYDGSLGQPVAFVNKFKTRVGALAQGTPENSRKLCSGTLISEDLFLTASHCVDSTITTKFAVFNFETAAGSSNLLPQDHYKISAIVENGGNLDYSIIRLEGKPGLKYGFTPIRVATPENNHLLTIIQHPKGQPKQTESGPIVGESGAYMRYADLDTEPGSSGSGVLDKDGYLVGVHTNGGCTSGGGANQGVKMTEIAKVSATVQALAAQAARQPVRR
jgi:V8-like Glu-specific endopeptidase